MELRLDVSPGELTRAEQKILDYINTNPDTFLFLSIGQLASAWSCRTPPSPGLPGTWAAPTSRTSKAW